MVAAALGWTGLTNGPIYWLTDGRQLGMTGLSPLGLLLAGEQLPRSWRRRPAAYSSLSASAGVHQSAHPTRASCAWVRGTAQPEQAEPLGGRCGAGILARPCLFLRVHHLT